MPTRPYSIIRVSDFKGLNDGLTTEPGDDQASTFTNGYKKKRKMVRRKGQSVLGSASLSPDQNLNLLEWCRIGDTEHLIGVHAGDIVDFLDSPVGRIQSNGTDRLPTSTDANAAWVEGHLIIGNGTDANVRFNGRNDGLAADFPANATDALKVNRGTNALFEGQDLTVAVWVRFDDLAFNATALSPGGRLTICAIDDRGTSARKSWRLVVNPNTNRLNFAVHDAAGAETTVADTTALAVDTWYFVTARHNAATDLIAIQVNGGTITTAACAHGLDQPAAGYFSVGYTPNLDGATGNDAMNGRVGPLGVWRSAEAAGGALSDALMTALYNGGVPLEEADLAAAYDDELVAFWDMGESSGTRDDDHNAGTTFDLIAFGAGVGSAAGPHGARDVARQMVQAVTTAPTVDLDVGATHESTGETQGQDFVYRISFLNADGEPGEAGPEGLDAAYTFNLDFTSSLTNIPVCPAGQDCSGRRIWRRSGGSTVFRLVADILDNTTTSYLDEVLNDDLGEELVEGNVATPAWQYLTEWKGRLVGAGNAADPQLIGISNQYEHFYTPEVPNLRLATQGSRFRLQGRAAGRVTGLRTHGGVVAVFTGGAGFLLQGDQAANFSLQEFTHHGCVAHRTIVSARDVLLWLSNDGVYAWVGGRTIERISDDVSETLGDLTAAQLAGAHAALFEDRYWLMWDTGCLVYDLQYRQWSSNSNNLWRDATASEYVSGGKQRLWGAREGFARVYQLETGNSDAIPSAGTAITMTWASKDWDCGLPGRQKRIALVLTDFRKSTGTATITLFRGTGESIQTLSHNTADVSESSSETVSKKRQAAKEEARSENFKVQVAIASTADDVELLAVGLMYSLAD